MPHKRNLNMGDKSPSQDFEKKIKFQGNRLFFLEKYLDFSPHPSFIVDCNLNITHWNRSCAALTGLSDEQMVGSRDLERAFGNNDVGILLDFLLTERPLCDIASRYTWSGRCLLDPAALEVERFYENMGKDGRWLHISAVPIRDANGHILEILTTLQDITRRRDDERLLEEQTDALLRSHAELEDRVQQRTADLAHQLHFLQQLIEAIPAPVFYKGNDARFLGANSAFESFVGLSSSQIIGKTGAAVFPSEIFLRLCPEDEDLLVRPGKRITEVAIMSGGALRNVIFHRATITRSNGQIDGLVGILLDISERKRLEDDLRQAAQVFECSAEGIMIADPDCRIVAVNRAFTEITGYAPGEVIGQTPRLLSSGRHDHLFYRRLWRKLIGTGIWQGELWDRRKNGEIYPAWTHIASVRDAAGALVSFVSTFSDLTGEKQADEKIQFLAFFDSLTELPNRRLLLSRLDHALAGCLRGKRLGALFFIDLDDFKSLNDTMGHDVGDKLLQEAARRLSNCVRDGDTVARLGGDEFVVMLQGLSGDRQKAVAQSEVVARKIHEELNKPYLLEGQQVRSTPSIGIALFGDHDCTVDDLLRQADLAMYQAKGNGRNTMRLFDPEMQSTFAARVALEGDLRRGLETGQFELYYQPQTDSQGSIIGAEALVRWRHPDRGMVPPADFIPVAEECGLILPIGHWVLETACAQLARWAKSPRTDGLVISVNVSARQFHRADFVGQVLSALDSHGANPHRLKIELTESLLLEDIDGIIDKMNLLKKRGVGFALDDFGTGYSSLSYLHRLPLDQLKIDKSFVRQVQGLGGDGVIARTIVALGQSLDLQVVAEGVETGEEFEFLSQLGCNAYQGYLLSPPLPLDEFERLGGKTISTRMRQLPLSGL